MKHQSKNNPVEDISEKIQKCIETLRHNTFAADKHAIEIALTLAKGIASLSKVCYSMIKSFDLCCEC